MTVQNNKLETNQSHISTQQHLDPNIKTHFRNRIKLLRQTCFELQGCKSVMSAFVVCFYSFNLVLKQLNVFDSGI